MYSEHHSASRYGHRRQETRGQAIKLTNEVKPDPILKKVTRFERDNLVARIFAYMYPINAAVLMKVTLIFK